MSTSTLYVDAFLTKKPKDGIHIVQTRLKDAMALDIEIAEYFKERAQIEEDYAKSLSSASKRLYTTDPMILGHFAPVWEALVRELNQVSKYHSDMAYKITHEIEKPLRSSPSSDYQKLQQLEPIIQSLEKTKFPSVKGSILRKSKNASSNPSWKNEGAEYLNLHQRIDEARLQRLKQSVEHFEQLQSTEMMNRVNLANTNYSIAERFDIQHDIRDFCVERGKGLATVHPHMNRSNTSLNSLHESAPTIANSTPAAVSPNLDSSPNEKHASVFMGRERSSTSTSNDSHRSSNKFKSLFTKKKKSFDQEEPKQHTRYAAVNEDVMQSTSPTTSQPTTVDSYSSSQPPTTNNATLIDAEGYSIPTYSNNFYPNTASDISSRNTSDDVDSDFQSLKLNQKLKINIKDDIVQEEATEATESFNKMANMLRERTPTITRKPRGRRESALLRSQTDPALSGTSPTFSQTQSMILSESPTQELSRSNPFMNSSPSFLETYGVQLNDTPMHLQSIPEGQPEPQPPVDQHLTISILEKTSLASPQVLRVVGQVYVSYEGSPSTAYVPLQFNHTDGVKQLTPNPDYIHTTEDGYHLNTTRLQDDKRPVLCFTYEFDTSSLALPVRLMPSWKCVDGTTYLMLKHEKNAIMDPAHLKGAVKVVMGDQQVTQVQSTPQGIWDMAKQQLTWNLKDLVQQYVTNEQPRLLAKFYLEGTGTPQPVYLSYSLRDSLVSGITLTSNAVDIKHTETMVQSDQIVYLP